MEAIRDSPAKGREKTEKSTRKSEKREKRHVAGRTNRQTREVFVFASSGCDELLRLRPGVSAPASLRPVARLIRHYNLALSKP